MRESCELCRESNKTLLLPQAQNKVFPALAPEDSGGQAGVSRCFPDGQLPRGESAAVSQTGGSRPGLPRRGPSAFPALSRSLLFPSGRPFFLLSILTPRSSALGQSVNTAIPPFASPARFCHLEAVRWGWSHCKLCSCRLASGLEITSMLLFVLLF